MALALDHTLSARLRRMVDTIVNEGDPVRIVLFGSQARGDATDASDVDLLIVVETPFQNGRERIERMTRLWRMLSDIRGPKDLLVCSLEEMEKWKKAPNHVIARALREGEVLCDQERSGDGARLPLAHPTAASPTCRSSVRAKAPAGPTCGPPRRQFARARCAVGARPC